MVHSSTSSSELANSWNRKASERARSELVLRRRERSGERCFRTDTGEGLRTVESDPRCGLGDGFGVARRDLAVGAGLTARGARGLLPLVGASVETLEGQANLMVQTRLGCSVFWSDSVLAFACSGVDSRSLLPPQAKVMHRFRPRLTSTFCSPDDVGRGFWSGPTFSSS